MELKYSILDPTGNITALVETPMEIARQTETAAAIMRRHTEVEQVGFLCPKGNEGLAGLRMAGGEFCGNASMCAAALLALRGERGEMIRLRVSGVAEPIKVSLKQTGENAFCAALQMPPAVQISEKDFSFENIHAPLSLVRMKGISHLVIEETSPFYRLLQTRSAAERAVKNFCAELSTAGLGLLFLEGEGTERRMTPLVFIPGSGTVFWENSCASGSAAVGMYLAAKSGTATDISLREPGGILRVKSDPAAGATFLQGGVRFVAGYTDEYRGGV